MDDTRIEYYEGIETDRDRNRFWYPVVKSIRRPKLGERFHEEL